MCTPSTYQSSITLPSMLSREDEKQSVRRVCKNVSVRTLLQSWKRWHLSQAGQISAMWMDGEHLLENTA